MRSFSYWLCFTLVAIPTFFRAAAWPLSQFGISLSEPPFAPVYFYFGSLVPLMLVGFVPIPVMVVLLYVMLLFVLRRAWLSILKGEGTPRSFRGFQKGLGYVGTVFFVVGVVTLVLSIVLRAGSGVPAAMLMIPAVFCIPWAFFLTEAFSLRKDSPSPTD